MLSFFKKKSIKEALANNIVYGVTKQTILNRIKAKYNVEDRYAKPAIKTALKKLREKRKVKRTVDGLYKKNVIMTRSQSKSKTRDRSKSRSRSRSQSQSRPVARSIKIPAKKPKSRSRSRSRPRSRAGSAVSFQSRAGASEWSSDTETVFTLKSTNSNHNLRFHQTNTATPVKSSYFLDENWPEKAEILNKNFMKDKNNIREILLRSEAVANPDGAIGLSRDQLVYEILTSFPSTSKFSYLERRQKIENALDDMKRTGEVIRCLDTGLLRLEKKLNSSAVKENLTMRNMNAFLASLSEKMHNPNSLNLEEKERQKDELLHKSLLAWGLSRHLTLNRSSVIVNCL